MEEEGGGGTGGGGGGGTVNGGGVCNMITDGGEERQIPINMENEKRMRREIANSNERRRMQSINAGFQSLRSLLPHHEGEKLSKVSISNILLLLYFIKNL